MVERLRSYLRTTDTDIDQIGNGVTDKAQLLARANYILKSLQFGRSIAFAPR